MPELEIEKDERTGLFRFLHGAWLGTYGWLLLAMITTLFLGPILAEVRYGVRIADLIAVLVVIAGIIAVTSSRHHAYTLAVIAFAAVIPQAIDPHIDSVVTGVIANSATLAFLTYILVIIFHDLFKTTRVTIDTLVGALCGYLLIAAIFAAAYSTVILFDGSAFLIAPALDVDPANLHFQGTHFGVLTYYSVITLTTVGYGDVVPASTISRGMASIEAVTGQIYLTVIVARLVGMHLGAAMK
jgi:hypothetical protein